MTPPCAWINLFVTGMPRSDTAPIEAPPLTLLATEPLRAAVEYTRMWLMPHPRERTDHPHPVVIFPGLGTDERFLGPLIEHCRRLGHPTYDWGRGLNRGPADDVDAWLGVLAREVHATTARHRKPVSLIGWSLGGIYAREVAKLLHRRIRQVITIGSPFAGTPEQTNAVLLYRWFSGAPVAIDPALARRLRTPPPVPTTSIYSRSDGVVAWQACIQQGDTHVEHVEVNGSHLGMMWNPNVIALIAERLGSRAITPPSIRRGRRLARARD